MLWQGTWHPGLFLAVLILELYFKSMLKKLPLRPRRALEPSGELPALSSVAVSSGRGLSCVQSRKQEHSTRGTRIHQGCSVRKHLHTVPGGI